jgi:hypothetical protein
VKHSRERDCDHPGAEGREDGPQLRNAFAVRPAATADVHGVADLEHIAAIQRARCLDAVDLIAEGVDGLLGVDRLGLALVGSGPRDDHDVAVDDHRVLDEDGVRTVVSGRDLERGPAVVRERLHIRVPLP